MATARRAKSESKEPLRKTIVKKERVSRFNDKLNEDAEHWTQVAAGRV